MTDTPPKHHSDQIENEIKSLKKEAEKPKRDNRVLVFILSFVIISGLLAAFLITTNQNMGTDADESPLSGLDPAFVAKLEPLQKRLESNPNDIEAMIDIGFLYFDARAYREAIGSFENAEKIDVENIDAIVGLGMAYQAVGRPDEAGPLYDRALEIEPASVFATIRKAYLLSAADKGQEALDLLRKLDETTDDAQAKASIAEAIDQVEKKPAD